MTIKKARDIMIAPLDWGLGHTTRCLPLIHYLQQQGHRVTIAGNERQLAYINDSIGAADTILLEGYNISYSRTRAGFSWSIMAQMPQLLRKIRQEHKWLDNVLAKRKFDGVISDNRYGLFHKKVPSVIMTHQLQVRTGMGPNADALLRTMHYRLLNRFKQCWVVDIPGVPNLGGYLSHPTTLPKCARYMGLLTQLEPASHKAEKHLMIMLSGPEPQRSILSAMLWKQVQGYDGQVVFVEGSDDAGHPLSIPPHISYYGRITGAVLQPLLNNASMVVCRSGYSTLMDIAYLQKKAILVPTPGQTEQEYLGNLLHREGIYYSTPQDGFDLQKALADAQTFRYRQIDVDDGYNMYRDVLDKWIDIL